MAWEGSDRRDRLPSNWREIRLKVLRRDRYQCQAMDNFQLCLDAANQVDHITPGDNHSMSNLQALCEWHHNRKSSKEGFLARQKKALERKKAVKLDHPGMREK